MEVQVLVATMNQNNYALLEKMNIRSNAIIGNQCDDNSVADFIWKGHKIKYLNFAEKGVGLNRNNALMRANGDYCLFADDDMVYDDDYVEKVRNAFNKIKDADIIIFNLKEKNPTRFIIKKITKVNYFNYLRYGTARVAVKLKSVRNNGIFYSSYFFPFTINQITYIINNYYFTAIFTHNWITTIDLFFIFFSNIIITPRRV